MYCRNCGNNIGDNVNFCTKCGAKVNRIENNLQQQFVPTENQQVNVGVQQQSNNLNNGTVENKTKKKNKTLRIIIVILFLIILIILGILFGSKFFSKESDVSGKNTNTGNNIVDVEEEYEGNFQFVTKFNNYNVEINMEMVAAGVTTKMVSTGIVDEVHQKEYLDVTTTSMGLISLNSKLYHDYVTGYTYMTQPYGGDAWWKEKSVSQIVDLGTVLDKLISMDNVTKVSDDYYKVKMTKDDVEGLLASGNADTSSISGDIYVDVYTENGYVVKLEYDFTQLISAFDSFTTTIEFSNYDNAGDVEIPQDVIDNAKEQ